MYTAEIILFVPLETDSLVHSAAYKEFMQRQFDRIPEDQHELQSHRSHWTPQEFERRGYAVTMIENFHSRGFMPFSHTATSPEQSLNSCSAGSRTILKKGVRWILLKSAPPPTREIPADPAEVFGHVGKSTGILPLRLLTNPENISIGDRVVIREGAVWKPSRTIGGYHTRLKS